VFPLSGYRLASSSRSLTGCRSWSMRVAAMVSLQGTYEDPGARHPRIPSIAATGEGGDARVGADLPALRQRRYTAVQKEMREAPDASWGFSTKTRKRVHRRLPFNHDQLLPTRCVTDREDGVPNPSLQVAHRNHNNPEEHVSGTRAGLRRSTRCGETRQPP